MLNQTLLQKVKHKGKNIVCQCPACFASGRDKRGDHLWIDPEGRFGCCVHPEDREHRREIFKLVGVLDASHVVKMPMRRKTPTASEIKEKRMKRQIQRLLPRIHREYLWELPDLWESSPLRLDHENCRDPRLLLQLFPSASILWTGENWQSGEIHGQGRFRSREQWICNLHQATPMVSPAIWKEGITSRSKGNVLENYFTVLDFDEIPEGSKTGITLHEHALAVTQWLIVELGWKLAAIVDTGGKGLHVWFYTRDCDPVGIKILTENLGLDASLIGNPEHPCRLPNAIHQKTGKRAKLLWCEIGI